MDRLHLSRADDELLDQVARRAQVRRFFVLATVRVFLVLAGGLPLLALVYVLAPSQATLGAGAVVGLFILGGSVSLLIEANRAVVADPPWLRTAAAALQAAFYTTYIAGAVFVFVVHTRLLFSGFVTLNLFGWLFWRFRQRYVDVADEESEPPSTP